MRIPLSTTIKTRTGVPAGKDARLVNSYVEVKGEQSVVRKRPIAQGGVVIGTGTAQGGIGFTLNGIDYIYTVNGDVGSVDTLESAGTSWNGATSYSVGDHVAVGFVDYWALTDNTNQNPTTNPDDWSTEYVPDVPFAGTYATFDPLRTSAYISLSSGNLVGTNGNTSNWGVAKSTLNKSSGKWYWEIARTKASASATNNVSMIGIAAAPNITNSILTDIAIGYAINWSPSQVFDGNDYVNYGVTCAQGTVIGVAVDFDARTINFYPGGVAQGAINIPAYFTTFYAAISPNGGDTDTEILTANFGTSAFVYSVPSGYNSGLYTL